MCFKTMIGIINETEIPKVYKVCKDISVKDISFKYRIVQPRTPDLKSKFVAILIVKSPTIDLANSRGGWLIHRMKDAKVADYFWVKEHKSD